MLKKKITFSLIVLSTLVYAQKKPLSIQDFASWNRIKNRQISNNGEFIAYELNQQKGDGKLIIYNIEKESNDTIPFGYDAKFSPNSDFIIFKYKPAADSTRAAKKAKVKKDKMLKDSVGIYNLQNQKLINYTKLKSFAVPKEKASWLAVLVEHQASKPDTTQVSDTSIVADTLIIADTLAKPKKKKKEKDLKDLFVHNPITDTSFSFNHVESYSFSKEGKILGIITKEIDSIEISTVIAYNTELQLADTIFRDTGLVKKLAVDKLGNQLAFLFSKDTIDEKVYSLHLSHLQKKKTQLIVDTLSHGLPPKYSPSEHGGVYFSDDGTKLFFGTALKPKKELEDSLLTEEKPKLDVWSWTDIELQPMQLKNVSKEKKRSYLAVYRIKEKKIIQIADSIAKSTRLLNKKNGEVALGWDELPYKRATSWNAKWVKDYYLIDLKTGDKEKILKAKDRVYLSPNGQYTVWYEQNDSSYYARSNKNGKTLSLTKDIKVAFYKELHDMPVDPGIYGTVGWSKNNEILIYDRYDIWKCDLTGKNKAQNLTNGFGRINKISLRYKKLDADLTYIPFDKEIILEGFDENAYQSGFYKTVLLKSNNPVELIKGDYKVGTIRKAKNADILTWSTQTVKDYPEIKISGLDFKEAKTISKTNTQQKDFNWATTTPVKWPSFTGEILRGTLYKPQDFDSTKKYPMVVYFYERSSEEIHRHYTPYPSHSIINKTFYASNGYLVFVPDITYKDGYPGQSAYNAIVSGVQYLINTHPYVNAKKIGLQGQSWGGYQTAYLITQTNMFAAAMGGAIVSNMTSAYGGIRWGTGMSRMFQYEHTQSRIGGSLWEKPMLYIENSPIFHAPKVNTPLLLMHNDNDGSVPWYQGIEYFVALRRLNKPVWMLNYNGMEHNIASKYWANRIDLSKRMFQFFNHYLKDEPASEWMTKGVKAIDKGKNLGY